MCKIIYKFLLISFICFYFFDAVFSQGTWTQKANFGGGPRGWATGFSIGSKGYIGLGANPLNVKWNDFWEWDQATNVWTQKATFPGTARDNAVGFSIGTKGYFGIGGIYSGGPFYSDFWEWDQATNTWAQRANFPGTARQLAVGFSIGNKGYIGSGGVDPVGPFYSDFWEYDPAINVWIQKANFGGTARNGAAGFSIGTNGYIGTGNDGSWRDDFWEWDPIINVWTQKANFGGGPRYAASAFSIGNKGYIGTGYNGVYQQTFWEWDQATNMWTQMANFGGGLTSSATGFSIGSCGYIGTGGSSATGNLTDSFWEFDPSGAGGCSQSIPLITINGTSVCSGGCVTISSAISGGITPFSYLWNPGTQTTPSIVVCPTSGTTYSITVTDASGNTDVDTAIVSVNPAPAISISGNTSICIGDSTMLSVSGGYSYQWNTGDTNSSVLLFPTTTTNYSVIAINTNGCTAAASTVVNVIPCSAPVSAFSSVNNTVCINNCIQFNDQSTGSPYSWSWTFPGGNPASSGQKNPLVCYDSAGTYNVTLITTNSIGSDTANQSNYIIVNDCYCPEIFLPNAFSPNSDNENDILFPLGTKCVNTFFIAIYNRWGEKVFETTDVTKGWDGKYNDKTESSGVYTYYLEATYSSGNEIKKRGNISLLR